MDEPIKLFSENPEELADIIDSLMSQGNGHVNVVRTEDGEGIAINTVKSTDCSGKKGACCQPTEFDDDED
ncbi:MAG: hypothetical protein MJ081_08575 [Ruminococcus sp.]|nr:hypothetical protein [Ruminococcus sp.]